MGKRIITQRRGSGNPRYQSPSHRFKGRIEYPKPNEFEKGIGGQIIELMNDPGRSAPLAKILLENFEEIKIIAPEGVREGDWIQLGGEPEDEIKPGYIIPVGQLMEGTRIYNIEKKAGDGGKFVRSSGGTAYIVSHDRKKGTTIIRLPSKKTTIVESSARASIGKVAGGGRKAKPMVHAGQIYHAKKARGKLYSKVKGVAMNAIDHPHGGSHKNIGKPTTVARNTPPGRKVGHIAAKRTGKKKRK